MSDTQRTDEERDARIAELEKALHSVGRTIEAACIVRERAGLRR